MSITHHPTEATVLDHAAGRMHAATGAVVAAHLQACPQCRALARMGEAIGGSLLEALTPEAMAPDALAVVMALLDRPAPVPPAPPPPALLDGVELPRVVQRLAQRRGGLGRWRWLAPGIQRISLLPEPGARRDGTVLYLLKIAPGTAIPEHGHHGHEMVCVLAGSFTDALGQFRPGDLAETGPEVEHTPVADAGTSCICLSATDAPLRFRSRAARLMQSVMGY